MHIFDRDTGFQTLTAWLATLFERSALGRIDALPSERGDELLLSPESIPRGQGESMHLTKLGGS